MEYVVLTGVPLIDGDVEATRTAVGLCCARFGEVADVVVSRSGGMASVGFLHSTSAQEAVLKLNGAGFHGGVIYAHVAPPPRTWLPGFVVTMRPTCTLLVENESFLRVTVKLRRCAGVASLTSVGHNACLVALNSASDGLFVKSYLTSHPNRKGKPVSAVFLRKE